MRPLLENGIDIGIIGKLQRRITALRVLDEQPDKRVDDEWRPIWREAVTRTFTDVEAANKEITTYTGTCAVVLAMRDPEGKLYQVHAAELEDRPYMEKVSPLHELTIALQHPGEH